MRLVMVVFTALSFAACLVEGPGAGEAKYQPPPPLINDGYKKRGFFGEER